LEVKVYRFPFEGAFPIGAHTLRVEARQTAGARISCGIYVEIVDYGFTGGYSRIGDVRDGVGSATMSFNVEAPETAPEGPVYLTFRVGVGTFDPYDYTVRFNVSTYIDDMKIFEYELDMRSIGEVTVQFKGLPVMAPARELKPSMDIRTLTPIFFGIMIAAIPLMTKK